MKNNQYRRISYEVEALIRLNRIAIIYSLVILFISLGIVIAVKSELSEAGLLVGILAALFFGLINWAIVLAILVNFLMVLADAKTPPPPKIADRFIPVKQYGELKGHLVSRGGGVNRG